MKNRLRVLRAEHNLSQGDLADRLEVSRQTVNAIETEKYDPSLPLAFKIATLSGRRSKKSSHRTAIRESRGSSVTSAAQT